MRHADVSSPNPHLRVWIILAVVALIWLIGALAGHSETLTCSTWMGVRTCQGPGGYVSHESEWMGRTTGRDNQGNEWSSSQWNGRETITIRRKDR
jgi:hypothetical protein